MVINNLFFGTSIQNKGKLAAALPKEAREAVSPSIIDKIGLVYRLNLMENFVPTTFYYDYDTS